MSITSNKAYTLVELLVAVAISTILVVMVVSMYNLIRKSMDQDVNRADMAQNARVAMERLSRDLRQTPDVVTVLPTSPSDTTVTEPHAIEFEDGHANNLTYLNYYLNGTTLEMDTVEYYFSDNPNTRVKWDATENGTSPVSAVISTQDVADMAQTLNVYENNSLIQVQIITTDGATQTYALESSVEERN